MATQSRKARVTTYRPMTNGKRQRARPTRPQRKSRRTDNRRGLGTSRPPYTEEALWTCHQGDDEHGEGHAWRPLGPDVEARQGLAEAEHYAAEDRSQQTP